MCVCVLGEGWGDRRDQPHKEALGNVSQRPAAPLGQPDVIKHRPHPQRPNAFSPRVHWEAVLGQAGNAELVESRVKATQTTEHEEMRKPLSGTALLGAEIQGTRETAPTASTVRAGSGSPGTHGGGEEGRKARR